MKKFLLVVMIGVMSWVLLFSPVTVNATEVIDLTSSDDQIVDLTKGCKLVDITSENLGKIVDLTNQSEVIDLTNSSGKIVDITGMNANEQVVDLTRVGTTKKVLIKDLSKIMATKQNIKFLKKLKDFDLIAVLDGVAVFEDDKNIVIINFSDVPCGESKKNYIKYGEKLKISWYDETFCVYYAK